MPILIEMILYATYTCLSRLNPKAFTKADTVMKIGESFFFSSQNDPTSYRIHTQQLCITLYDNLEP